VSPPRIDHEFRLRSGASEVSPPLPDLDAETLYELTMHCRDRGHRIAASARKRLFAAGLIGSDGNVPEPVRKRVLAHVEGQGLAMRVDGRPASTPNGSVLSSRIVDLVEREDYARASRVLIDAARSIAASKHRIDARAMSTWAAAASTLADPERGHVTPALQSAIHEVEKLEPAFSRRAKPIFQDLVAETGAKLTRAIAFPERRVPYWLKGPQPLAGFQSHPKLPRTADIVIIGAGLTGASAAYHLSRVAERKGLRVVVVEAGDPAGQASGRNGGNFELIPENFFGEYGTYDGLERERYKFLRASYPDLPQAVLSRQSKRIARTIVEFALENAKRMRRTIERERIDCDFSPVGWLRTSLNEREIEGSLRDAELAKAVGGATEILDERTILERYGFPAPFGGRLIQFNGNYHPFKLVCGELSAAIDRGIELYTRTPVESVISKQADLHFVKTKRGTIEAKRVVVATNAFTARLFPELSDIRPFRSQIASYNHVEDRLEGITVTAKDGDIYANFPKQDRYVARDGTKRGTLNVGNDVDTEVRSPESVPPSRTVFHRGRPEIVRHFPAIDGQPPIRAWAGPMAFVEGRHGMRMPALGPLGEGPRAGVFLAVWCNGYGGSGCHNAGAGAARWALTGRIPKDMPQDVFGPGRLFTDVPLFDTRTPDE
jgi:glycine/D-amino acid oxidase-like deaminating enzyme